MTDLAQLSGYTAGILTLAAYIPYVSSILKKKTRPSRSSWFIWMTVSTIIAVSYNRAGADFAFIMPVGYALGSAVIALLSIRYGADGWTWLDKCCLMGAGLGLVAWGLSDDPMAALLINVAINLAGTLPTIRKAYYYPETENNTAWVLFFAGTEVNLLAVQKWTFDMAVYPVYMVLIIGLVSGLVVWRRESSPI
jgi:hypothetical protein